MKTRTPLILLLILATATATPFIAGHCVEIMIGFAYPSPMHPDTDIELSITVKNLGPKSIRVSSISVRFDWATELSYSAQGTPQIIASGTEATFPLRIHVPDGITTNIDHVATITVQAADPANGAWEKSQSLTTKFIFYVSKPPPPKTEQFGVTQTIAINRPTDGFIPVAPNPLLALIPILVFIAILMILAYTVVKVATWLAKRPRATHMTGETT